MTHLLRYIFALAALGSAGWLLAFVLGFRAVNAEAREAELRRELTWWQRQALKENSDDRDE